MKTMRLLTVALLLSVCTATFAQYDDDYYYYGDRPTSYYRESRTSYYGFDQGWGNIYFTYSPLKLTSSYDGGRHDDYDDISFNAFTVGFSYTQPLGGPFCVEAAFETTGAYFSEHYYNSHNDYVTHKYDLYWSKVPVNLVLRFDANDNFALIPFAGLNAKLNISGTESEETYDKVKWDLFDEHDMGGDTFNRFQLGYQAGVKLLFANAFSVAASFGGDITPLYSDHYVKQKFQGFTFSAGYNF
jgi:hypothetical protein